MFERSGHSNKLLRPGPGVINLFFMLNSTEHEIVSAHKCFNAKNCILGLDYLSIKI